MRSIYRRVSATGDATSVIRLPGQIHSLTNLTSQPLPSLKSVGISFANSGSCEATRGFSSYSTEIEAAFGKNTCQIEFGDHVRIGRPGQQKPCISALFQDSSVGRAFELRSGRFGRQIVVAPLSRMAGCFVRMMLVASGPGVGRRISDPSKEAR